MMFLILLINNAFASTLNNENQSIMSGDSGSEKIITLDEQRKTVEMNTQLSQEQKNSIIEKINFAEERSKISVDNKGIDYQQADIGISVPYYRQINNYYCGPATTKQTMQYLIGQSDSQQTIASALGTTTAGTDGTKIVSYLNSHQTENYYIITSPASANHMADCTAKCMADYFATPIVRVKMQTNQGWSYNSNGHFMNITGQLSPISGFEYTVVDPYIQYVDSSNTTGRYTISINVVYASVMNHFAQHFYW